MCFHFHFLRLHPTISMSPPPVIFVMGVSGSGKSTVASSLASSLEIPFLEGDSFHPESNVRKMASGIPLNDEDRFPWLHAIRDSLDKSEETSVVISCSMLKRAYRRILFLGLRRTILLVYLNGTFELLQARVERRSAVHFMPASLLRSQFDALEEPTEEEMKTLEDQEREADKERRAKEELNVGPWERWLLRVDPALPPGEEQRLIIDFIASRNLFPGKKAV